jgi:hypothetical protein
MVLERFRDAQGRLFEDVVKSNQLKRASFQLACAPISQPIARRLRSRPHDGAISLQLGAQRSEP